jgi:hypothetical protein
MKRHFDIAWRNESRAVPGGRAAWLARNTPFYALLHGAPFPE